MPSAPVDAAVAAPRLSIVTIHREDFEGLAQTLESVRRALGSIRAEWIVVDGASDWCRHPTLRAEVSALAESFVSEPDRGLYDAMNKGTRLARGEFVLYLNAGDRLRPEGLERLVAALGGECAFDVLMFDSHEGNVSAGFRRKRARGPGALWYGMPTHHQAIAFRRLSLGENPYDLEYRIAADYDLVCRLAASGNRFAVEHESLCEFDLGGLSSKRFWDGLREQQRVRAQALGVGSATNLAILIAKSAARVFRQGFPLLYNQMRYRPDEAC
jgi:putative colanic acid biosynthesis glycosyltransferase